MKKTTCLILFLLFFSTTSLVVHAQTPPDQDFGTYEDVSYGGSVTYELITYTGSDASVGIGDREEQAISLSPLFSGSAVVMGGNTPGGYVSFKSSSSANNFKIVSFVAEFYGHSNGFTSEAYEIIGYDNGAEVVSVGNFDVTSSGSYGTGNASITWSRENYNNEGNNSGTLSFGSSWSNIDEIRFYPLDAAPNNNLFVGLDNIDFEPAVLSATAPTVSTSVASSITSTGAIIAGNVTSDGGASVTERGFVYSSTDDTPTIGETNVTNVPDGDGTGVFSEAISGLNSSTTYYYQAYATNSEGTTYGGVQSLITSAPPGIVIDFEAATGIYSGWDSNTLTIDHIDITPNFNLTASASPISKGSEYGWAYNGAEGTYFGEPNFEIEVVLSVDQGSVFDLKSLYISNQGNADTDPTDFTFSTSKGSVVISIPLDELGNLTEVNLANHSNSLYFEGISSVTIQAPGSGLWFEIDDIEVSNVDAAPSTIPLLNTDAASAITASGATLNGNVTSDGGATVTARGFVYSSSNNTPTIGEIGVTQVTDGSGTGVFDEAISGLSSSTTYYYQAYATNSEGTSYGGVVSFTTSSPQLENFSWSADNLSAGATGVTYTFEYTTVTDLAGFDAVLYALNTANGWNTNSVTVGDITVLVNGTSRTVAGIFSVGGSGAFITLDNPIVTGGSEVIVTIANVANNVNPGTYNWNWIYTATSGGNQIDPAVSPNPIVLSANNAPTVTTATASNVTTTTATLGGNVTDNGGASVTERGIVYNTTGTPNIDDDTKVQIGFGDGSFSDEIIGLIAGTTYYVRAYATNTAGTSYGGEESFITSTLGLEEELLNNSISLYPNPVNDLLYLAGNIKVEKASLFDVLGKRIDNIKIENDAINLSNIKIGIYLLKIETDKGSLVKRIVKK